MGVSLTARYGSAPTATAAGVATSQRGWGEALVSLLTARGVPAVALDPSGRPWGGTDTADTGSGDRGTDSPSWRVIVVDAADAAAPQILSSLPANARVGLGERHPALLASIDVWVDSHDPRRLVAAVRDPRASDRPQPERSHRRLDAPTARERAVLDLLREGLSNAEIARCLGLSPNTVRTHVQNLLAKLGVRSRFEAAVIANSEHFQNGHEVLR